MIISMIIINTGNGKGKTTAALGQALRSVGEGKRVLMVQFIKGPWKSGEDDAQVIQGSPSNSSGSLPAFELAKMGKGFVGILGDKLPREEHAKAAREALGYARAEMETGKWDIIILDEVNNAIALGLILEEDALAFAREAKEKVEHVIFTGRDAPKELIDIADLVTEMRDVKHPYEKGIKARRGLEY
ncbi:MAG: cob(I)yrinic acid a,c-diamide adenosyltransferase [Candidatus Sungbacteria bacterium RIFCSPLOWO2_01_FULL_60_25]|uniref:Cob(I)yrinic acid a,c-diamide adenosyltransferase n=1 Tax=Candidatus Sungbacteria bacterium RIFCSPLOWO2_01_FULL_60_25 TaxID=1802281 RepID=A0A1G2L9Q2_9BACT|nr:MAG: cob(I)yrinic acid a,c-diamide adenosyltransferase [Candidatus Sungbacteria bacterium RIFCSPLOWO2_01_FULL_60_25]